MSALGAEVVWTRLLSLMLGAHRLHLLLDPGRVPDRPGDRQQPRGLPGAAGRPAAHVRWGLCQWLLTAAIAWTAVMISESLPYWPIVPGLSPSPWYTFQLDLVRCLWAVLPPACLWGASFPLALAAVASRGQDPGRLVGGVYAANTIGAIAGALGLSLFLIAGAGSAGREQILIALASLTALLLFVTAALRTPAQTRSPVPVALALLAALAPGLSWVVPPLPGELVAWGRQMPTRKYEADVLYVGEGMDAATPARSWK